MYYSYYICGKMVALFNDEDRSEFDSLLNCHAINEKTGIQETQQYINKLTDIGKKYLYKKALMISLGIKVYVN